MRRTVDFYVSVMPARWSMPEEDTQFEDRMLDQIVGFRIPIDSIQGKWKLSQNHPLERREKNIVQPRMQGDADSLAIAHLMEAGLSEGSFNSPSVNDREGLTCCPVIPHIPIR